MLYASTYNAELGGHSILKWIVSAAIVELLISRIQTGKLCAQFTIITFLFLFALEPCPGNTVFIQHGGSAVGYFLASGTKELTLQSSI